MTLGLTSSGAVKIKTDNGLRAVNCACCGGCGCGISIPQALRELVANATISTVTMYGYSPKYLEVNPLSTYTWIGAWHDPDPVGTEELANATFSYDIATGCLLHFSGDHITWIPQPPVYGPTGDTIRGIGIIGTPEGCGNTSPAAVGTFTINGAGAYPYYYLTGFDDNSGANYGFVPPPNFVFT